MQLTDKHRQHWRKNSSLTSILLVVWAIATFVIPYFARELSFSFLGWPFGFWMTAQGALIAYVLITWIYARRMHEFDEEYGVGEGEE